MVVLNKIYTRTGDDGTTGLGGGERVRKDSLRVTAFGEVDETNSCLGLARLHAKSDMDAMLARIQNDLFDLGADLCTLKARKGGEALRIMPAQVARLESEIDRLNESLSPLRSFVLPGGSAFSAGLHLARAVCRRAERAVVALHKAEPGTVNQEALLYLNRLSDLLFVAARAVNAQEDGDVLWVPGLTRGASA